MVTSSIVRDSAISGLANVPGHIAGTAADVVGQPAAFALIRTPCPVRRIFAAIRCGARRWPAVPAFRNPPCGLPQPAVPAFRDGLRLALAGRH